MFSLQPRDPSGAGQRGAVGLKAWAQWWGEGSPGHSQAALARRPLHDHPLHHLGPAGMKEGERPPTWLVPLENR